MSQRDFSGSTGEAPRGWDEGRRPPAERWDRERFERMRSRAPEERERFHYEEHGRPGHLDVEIDFRESRRAPPTRVAEREPVHEAPPRRIEKNIFYEPSPSEIANRALAPYRRISVVEKDLEPLPIRRPARPQVLRRQSSLDTFDRRPVHRYGDEYRLPADVPVPLPIRRLSPARRSSPSHRGYREEEIREVKYRGTLTSGGDEEYRETRIKRGKSRSRRSAAPSTRASSSSASSVTEVSPVRLPGKKGKTRMPKRLAHKQAITELGYPYDEEEDFFIIKRALGKEQIDEIIEVSKTMREGPDRTVYVYDSGDTKTPEAPPISEPAPQPPPPPAPAEFDKRTIIEYQMPPPPPPGFMPPPEFMAPPPPPGFGRSSSPARSMKSTTTRHRSPSPARTVRSRHEYIEKIEESNHIGGPLTIVAPNRHREDSEIQREISSLEAERRALRLEREADEKRHQAERIRESDYEVVEHRHSHRERDVVRIEKDKKGRSRSKPPNSKLVAMAMATLG